MGASSSGLLDEAKISHIKGLLNNTLQSFSEFYRQQYSAAYCGHLHQEVEPRKEGKGLLLTHRPQYAPEKVLYQQSAKFSSWDEQGKKCKEKYIVLRRDYKVEIHENMETFNRGCAAKLVLQPAGGSVLTTEQESRALLEQTCAGILNGVKEDFSSVVSPDVFAVYLHLPYMGHTCFLFQQEEERDHFLSALKTCIRHCNLDPWYDSSYKSQAYIRALRLYRQNKGCYESWEILLGTEEQVLTSQVMDEVLPWLQSQLQSKVKGKKAERIRQWLATVQATYTLVLEQVTASLKTLREECQQIASKNQALIRSHLDQIMSSHCFLEEKVRACICEEAEKVCNESVAPYLSSILEALTGNISAGIQGMQHTLHIQMDTAFTHTKGETEETKKALSTLCLYHCFQQVENLTENLQDLKQRFGLSSAQRLVHSVHLEMEQLMDSAVYTLELFLQSSARLQPVQVPVKMERAKERVLKQLDYDSRVVQRRLYQGALLEITWPALTKGMDSKWKSEFQQFEQYIFSDYSNFILVQNVYDDVLRNILSKEIETVVQDAASKKNNNLLLDTSDLAISQYSLLGHTPPHSAPQSPGFHARDSSLAVPSGDKVSVSQVEEEGKESAPQVEEGGKESAPQIEEGGKESAPVVEEDSKESAPQVEEGGKESAPVVEEEGKKSAPVVEEEGKKSTPVVEEDSKESAPQVEEGGKESAPVVEEEGKKSAPVVEEEGKKSAPVVEEEGKKSAPVVEEEGKESAAVVEEGGKESAPVVEEEGKKSAPVVEEEGKESAPVVEEGGKESAPVVEDEGKESAPVVEEEDKEIVPVVEEKGKESAPVVEEEGKDSAPVVEEEGKDSAPVVKEKGKESAPVVEEEGKESAPVVEEEGKESAPVVEDGGQSVAAGVGPQSDPELNADISTTYSSDQRRVHLSPVIIVIQQCDESTAEETSCIEVSCEDVQLTTDTPTSAESSNSATPVSDAAVTPEAPTVPESSTPIPVSPDPSVSPLHPTQPTDVPAESAHSEQSATSEKSTGPDLTVLNQISEESSSTQPSSPSPPQTPYTDSPTKISLGSLSEAIGCTAPSVTQTVVQQSTDRAVYLTGEIKDNWELERVKEEKEKEATEKKDDRIKEQKEETESGEKKEEEIEKERDEGQTGGQHDNDCCRSSESPAESVTALTQTPEQRESEEKMDEEKNRNEMGTEKREEKEEEQKQDHTEKTEEEVLEAFKPVESQAESDGELPLGSVAIIRDLVTEITEVETIISPCPTNS
ncbi:hypothetical protein PAMA_005516 [Pampus argenteus]